MGWYKGWYILEYLISMYYSMHVLDIVCMHDIDKGRV